MCRRRKHVTHCYLLGGLLLPLLLRLERATLPGSSWWSSSTGFVVLLLPLVSCLCHLLLW
jgi:hypothetical protein